MLPLKRAKVLNQKHKEKIANTLAKNKDPESSNTQQPSFFSSFIKTTNKLSLQNNNTSKQNNSSLFEFL
jgi:chromatin segregation and condensation protein Rec8/ScpA/Scc1 (kleisin family)